LNAGAIRLLRLRKQLMKIMSWIPRFGRAGRPVPTVSDPDSGAYARYATGIKVFQPWHIDTDISNLIRELRSANSTTLVSNERLWTIKWAFLQTQSIRGEIWEAGVYRGGVARLLKSLMIHHDIIPYCKLRLFDTFEGLPAGQAGVDLHVKGDFSDTSLREVRAFVGEEEFIDYRPGLIPDSFSGLNEVSIRLAHIDVDLYESTLSCLRYIYPRLQLGGVIVLDDYGFVSCPGVRRAVDEFFGDEPDVPLSLPSGQAILVRTGGRGQICK
jgi:O-methyltransferase